MKSWLTSKTLWFNVVAGGMAVVVNSAATAQIDPMWQTLIVTGGNFALRFLTSTKLTASSTPA